MKRLPTPFVARVLLTANFLLLTNIVVAWGFVQFVHYDSQYTMLAPEHYQFDLVTKSDWEKLSDPAQREVTLSNGQKVVKAPAWDDLKIPSFYKPAADGEHYVKVTTLGTGHFARRWTQDMLLIFMFAVPAMILSLWNFRSIVVRGFPDPTGM